MKESAKINESTVYNEKRLKGILDNLQDAFFEIDQQGCFTYVNALGFDLFGYNSADELIDLPAKELYASSHERDRMLEELYKTGKIHDWIGLGLKKNGTTFLVSMNAQVLKDDAGHVTGTQGIIRDISVRQNILEALQYSEERNRLLSDVTMEGILIHKKGIVKEMNQAVLKIFGDQSIKLINRSFIQLIHPDDRDIVLKNMKGHFDRPFEVRAYRGTGEVFFLEMESKILHYQDEEWQVTALRDITWRKQQENESRQLIDGMNDTAFVINFDGEFVEINNAAVQVLGYTRDEFLNMKVFELDNKLTGNQIDELIEGIKTSERQIFETQHQTKDGKLIPVEISSSPVQFQGKACILSIARDISDRARSEKALRLSEEKFRKAFFTSPDTIAINRLEDGMYISINKGFTQILEYTEEEVLGKTSTDLTIWVDTEDRKRLIQELKSKGFVENVEAGFRGKSGKIIEGSMSTNIIELEGIPHIISITRDITERKRFEEALIAAKEKAEESDRLKSAFLANMSHEIRTPMNGILGFAELLKEPDLAGDRQQEYIRIIEKAGVRMLNIITDIVDISKIESGQMIVSESETNVNEQIEYLGKFFVTEADNKGLNLFIRNSLPSSEAIINSDREKLYAILTNLIKNAIKYTEAGSIELGCQRKEDFLEFYVKDTGIGVTKDRQQAIFERFIQADISNKMANQGAGLGLSISKAYVEMLGGKIWMESEKGIGSTFYFTLPYKAELEEYSRNVSNSPLESKFDRIHKLKILIVEDDEASEMLLSIMVKEFSHSVIIARNGLEVAEIYRKNPDIDLILMDIDMPLMNGYEATRQIRQFDNDVVIITQTAFALSGDKEKSMEAGCTNFITKPINKAEFQALIQQYFN